MAFQLVLLVLGVAVVTGLQPCGPLTGVWENQLGSKVHMHQTASGQLSGLYLTAVESRPGAAGNGNELYGVIDPNDGLLTFSVNWKGRTSVTTWVGQCIHCGDKDVIHTTWLLRRRQSICNMEWNSTYSNQDTFYRQTNVVLRNTSTDNNQSPAVEDQNECHLTQDWYNDQGGALKLSMANWNVIQGTVDKKLTRESEGNASVSGRWSSNDTSSNFGLHALNIETVFGKAVVGYAGQCYKCDNAIYLDTMWLARTPTARCKDSWAHFHIGRSKFTSVPPAEDDADSSSRII